MGKYFPMLARSNKVKPETPPFELCSDCFQDHGLKLDAENIGIVDQSVCPQCGSSTGRKLDKNLLEILAHRFFVWGTLHRFDYGAAPLVVFNSKQMTNIDMPPWFEADVHLFEKILGVGFFYYGPRFWMFGEVEPLKALQSATTRDAIVQRVVKEYPSVTFTPDQSFYRVRKDPDDPANPAEYDSQPVALAGKGRFDSTSLPVMYCSPDLPLCIHECRVTAEDNLFVATLAATANLKLLDLTELLDEKDVNEFTSLDMAIHMLFLAGDYSYEISRAIAQAARSASYDGIVYPSYFSLLRTGAMPFETITGLSARRFPSLKDREKLKTVPNLALFGRPIEHNAVTVKCINRLILSRVTYGVHFGPAGLKTFQ